MWGGQSGRQSQSEICRKPPDIGDRDGQGLKFTFCKAKFIIYQFDLHCPSPMHNKLCTNLWCRWKVYWNSIQTPAEEERCFGPKFQLFSVPRSSEWWRRLLRHLWQHKIFNNYCTGSVPVSEAEKLESHRCLNFTDGQNMKQPQNK